MKRLERRTAALKVPEEVREQVEKELAGLLGMSRNPDIPPGERAAYARIVSRLTDTLGTIQDPETPGKQRIAYTRIVDRATETLGVIQDPRTPREDRLAYTRIVDGTVGTLATVQAPGTSPGERATYTELADEMTERYGLFTDPETPEGSGPPETTNSRAPQYFFRNQSDQDVKTLKRAQSRSTPPTDQKRLVRGMQTLGTTHQILRDQTLSKGLRAQLEENVEQLSEALLKSYDRSASRDDRDKAKGTADDFINKLGDDNDKHADKPLLEIRDTPLNPAVAPGEFQSFTIKVTNHGDDDVTDVTVKGKFASASGGAEGGVIRPVLHAQLMRDSGDKTDCDLTAGNTAVNCPTGGDTKIVPEETVTVAIRAVVKASQVPYGEKENVTHVKYEEGAKQASAKFAVVRSPKLSEQDLEDELRATRQCAAHFASSGVSRKALTVFTEVMGEELGQRTSPAQASAEGYKAALRRAGPDEAVTLADIRMFDVSLRDAAKAFKSGENCDGFVDKALSEE